MNNIFFVSYPCSGSHWLLNVIKKLTGESWNRFGKDTDYESFLFIKSHSFIRYSGKTIYMYRSAKDVIFSWARAMHKSIEQWHADCNSDKFNAKFNAKWIRDKLIGNYYFPKDNRPDTKNSKVIVHVPAEQLDNQIADTWAAYMDFYHNLSEEYKVYYVRYENLVQRFKKTVKGVLKFCGLEANNLEVSRPLQPCSDKIGQYKKSQFWTKSIDDIVEKKIGKTIRKYRY